MKSLINEIRGAISDELLYLALLILPLPSSRERKKILAIFLVYYWKASMMNPDK